MFNFGLNAALNGERGIPSVGRELTLDERIDWCLGYARGKELRWQLFFCIKGA